MKTKKSILKICSIVLIALLVVLSLSSCKKKDSETKAVANPSALVNKDAVFQSDNSSQSIVSVPVPITVSEEKQNTSNTSVVTSEEKEDIKVDNVDNAITQEKEENKVTLEIIPSVETTPVVPQPPVFVSENKPSLDTESKVDLAPTVSLVDDVNIDEESPSSSLENSKDAANVEAGMILSDRFSIDGISSEFKVYRDNAVFTFNEPYPTTTFIVSVLEKVVSEYPMLKSSVVYVFDGDTLTLSYPEYYFGNNEAEVYNNLFILRDIALSILENDGESEGIFTREYQLYGKKVYMTATNSSAFITSDEAFTSNEIYEAIEILKANYPEESKYVVYSLKENGIELTYPTVDDNYIISALDALNDLILAYTPMPLTETIDVVPVSTEETEVIGDTPLTTLDQSSETAAVEPLTKAGKVLNNISLGVSLKGELDFSYPASPFVLGLEMRGEYKVNNHLYAGLKLGYDLSGYMPIMGYLKYNFSNPEGLYVFGEGGISIGMGGRPTGVILGGGMGYEIEVIDNLSIFGEAEVVFRSNSDKKLIPSISFGAKYSF